MSELKLEDLNAGDKLEFISDEMRESFRLSSEWAPLIEKYFTPHNKIIEIKNNQCFFEGFVGYYYCNALMVSELQYFKKAEQVEENTNLSDEEVQDLRQDLKDSYSEFEQLDKETPYVLVDAGIESYIESYTRQMAGERFMFGDKQMWFDSKDGNFMCDDKLAGPYKSEYRNFKVNKPWYETASDENPILCKVWDDHDTDFCYERVIFKECGYHTEDENIWENATPVKASECFDG